MTKCIICNEEFEPFPLPEPGEFLGFPPLFRTRICPACGLGKITVIILKGISEIVREFQKPRYWQC